MFIKQTTALFAKYLSNASPKRTILVGIALLSGVVCFATFFVDKSVEFSYNSTTCLRRITLLPSLSVPGDGTGFSVTTDKTLKIGDLQIASLRTCFTPTKAPQPGVSKVSVAPFGGWFARETFAVSVLTPPKANIAAITKPIPTTKPLIIALSSIDTVFDYQLLVEGKTASCPVKNSMIYCDIAPLSLVQGTIYPVELIRSFEGDKVDTAAKHTLATLTATSLVKSSVGEGQTVYEKPKSFTFEFDKDVTKANIVLAKVEGDKRTPVSSTVVLGGKQAVLNFTDDLVRDASYEISINKLEAGDGSTLVDGYKSNFKISGGPKVAAMNVGATRVAVTQTVVLTFDQSLSATQDITKLVGVKGVAATISKNDNQVLVSFANAPKCTDFTISIAGGLQSKYDVIQSAPWSFSARTVCYSISTIGYSVAGRPIVAYTFGNGGRTVLFTGAIHGSELSAKRLMDAWVSELEINARSIPADKQIVVIPSLNPDGVAVSRRNNSNNVDLNRNFNTADWQKDITSPSNQPIENGGGSTPMSEPETKAIAGFTSRLRPRLTMSFHSTAGYAIANQAGDSGSLAAAYAQMTGYRNMTGNAGAFDYSITGTYDDWIREGLGLPSVLVELASGTNAEFSRNKAALWAMARS